MAKVELVSVSKQFGTAEVLHDIDLTISKGEFVVIVGPSGCGKSTLLRMIAGLEDITHGELRIDGQVMNDVPPARRGIAMVFQSYALYPHMTVFENMAFGLEQARLPKREIAERVHAAAATLQIRDLLERRPAQLSGGQRQRVAIGRAITRKPRVFLFDEPLSNLDTTLRVDTRLEIARLGSQLPDTTLIYVTHDQTEAMTLADRIVVLNEGRIEQVGTPMELYDAPASLFVAGFIGSPRMNLLTGPVARAHDAETLGVRPEHVSLSDEHGEWSGNVTMLERLGSDTYLHVDVPKVGRLTVRAPGHIDLVAGDTVRLSPDPARLYRFDAHGRPSPVGDTAVGPGGPPRR